MYILYTFHKMSVLSKLLLCCNASSWATICISCWRQILLKQRKKNNTFYYFCPHKSLSAKECAKKAWKPSKRSNQVATLQESINRSASMWEEWMELELSISPLGNPNVMVVRWHMVCMDRSVWMKKYELFCRLELESKRIHKYFQLHHALYLGLSVLWIHCGQSQAN